MAAVTVGLLGVLTNSQMILGISKPVATVLLIAVLGALPVDLRGYLIAGGIVLSLAADIALLSEGQAGLLAGLMFFLMAHLCYGSAFWDARATGWLVAPGLVVFGGGSLWLFRHQRQRFGSGLRLLIALHALTLTLMVATVYSTLAGHAVLSLAAVASMGAVMFYLSQIMLPLVRLRRASVWAQSATLVGYWTGQLCLVLAARWGLGGKLVP